MGQGGSSQVFKFILSPFWTSKHFLWLCLFIYFFFSLCLVVNETQQLEMTSMSLVHIEQSSVYQSIKEVIEHQVARRWKDNVITWRLGKKVRKQLDGHKVRQWRQHSHKDKAKAKLQEWESICLAGKLFGMECVLNRLQTELTRNKIRVEIRRPDQSITLAERAIKQQEWWVQRVYCSSYLMFPCSSHKTGSWLNSPSYTLPQSCDFVLWDMWENLLGAMNEDTW